MDYQSQKVNGKVNENGRANDNEHVNEHTETAKNMTLEENIVVYL